MVVRKGKKLPQTLVQEGIDTHVGIVDWVVVPHEFVLDESKTFGHLEKNPRVDTGSPFQHEEQPLVVDGVQGIALRYNYGEKVKKMLQKELKKIKML